MAKPCTHCGKCCVGSPCGLAAKYGYRIGPYRPCPALVPKGSSYYCGLVLNVSDVRDIENWVEKHFNVECQ